MADRTNVFVGGTPYKDPDADADTDTDAGPERIIPYDMTVSDSSFVNPRQGISSTFAPLANLNSEITESVPSDDASVDNNIKCPRRPRRCNVCWKLHFGGCPYYDHIPRGATFNNSRFEINCACGNEFIEDRWACTACGGDWAVISAKYCHMCNIRGQHSSYECPKDKVSAAQYKIVRDKMRSRVPIPYNPESLLSE